MPDPKTPNTPVVPQRIKLTARLSIPAYDALAQIQHGHRRQTGSALPLWRILDAAILAYAQQQGIKTGAGE